MPIEFKCRDSARLALAISAAFPLGAYAANAGKVDFAVGNVVAVSADGSRRALGKGADVNSGETIDTGDGRAQVRFTDGAQVSLQPQTQFRVDEYRFNGKPDGEEKGFFSLLKGGLRTITGLVGRGNRKNYKITTEVATIGIRGTEYLAALNNGLNVTTGEGSVEVCNAAGCMILNSGESGFVPSSGSNPTRTESKTSLPPAPVTEGGSVTNEVRKSDESLQNSLPTLPSGSGYALAWAGQKSGSDYVSQDTGSATFNSSGELVAFTGSNSVSSSAATGALTDGVIGWGRWASGSLHLGGNDYTLSNTHYVVGVPTSAADMGALTSIIGTYSLVGYTFPTSTSGAVGGPGSVSGTLTADFFNHSVDVAMTVALGGRSLNLSVPSATITNSTFYGTSGPSTVNGFFAGANASRAGLTYQITDGVLGTVSGAAGFRMTSASCYMC